MHWRLFLLILMGQCSLFLCQHYQYYFINEPKTWDEAQRYCRENYTDLATVPNMTYMEKLYTDSTANPDEAWIGLYSISGKEKRMWHWSLPGVEFHDEEMTWNPGQPDDGGYLENCARIESSGGLVDDGCSNNKNFICYDEQNKSLHFIDTQKFWREAQSYCRENHTDLASGVKQLNDSVSKFNSSDKLSYWTGLFRDTWKWSDGSNSSYRLWESVNELTEETSKTDNGTRKCAMTAVNKPGKWSSDDCNTTKPFFCYDVVAEKLILITESKNWEEALNYCREHHRDLVSIRNLEEQKLVKTTAKNATTSHVWLGLRYGCALDLWFWVSDQVVCYKNWANEKVSDHCDLSVAMEKRGENKWFKKNDSEELNFICSLW